MYFKRIRREALRVLDRMEPGSRADLDMFSFVHLVEYGGVRRALLVTPEGVFRSWQLREMWQRWQPIDLSYTTALERLAASP